MDRPTIRTCALEAQQTIIDALSDKLSRQVKVELRPAKQEDDYEVLDVHLSAAKYTGKGHPNTYFVRVTVDRHVLSDQPSYTVRAQEGRKLQRDTGITQKLPEAVALAERYARSILGS